MAGSNQPEAGRTIGNYRLEAVLGSGGMGRVYRGSHVHLQRPAAIKVMHAHLAAEPRFRARFIQEAKAAAALLHPHIVEVYDFGEERGLLYLVTELVAGGSLRDFIERSVSAGQPLPLTLALDIARQTAEGLASAHAAGMVHRDIKPDNLLVEHVGGATDRPPGPGDAVVVKICDFGLARLAEGGVATATGATMGTPDYMSPEQCRSERVDGRSDLYSLGIILYQLVTAQLPFEAKTPTQAMYKHLFEAPAPPSQFRPDLPPAVQDIILRCLAKRPDERYATAGDLAAALAAAGTPSLPGRPVVRPVPSAGPGARAPAAPTLYVVDPQGRERTQVALTAAGVTIGRVAGNTVVLPDAEVSRHHLRIDWNGARVTVTDLGSSNGTLLGNVRLPAQKPEEWPAKQSVRVGKFSLRLELPGRRGP